MGTSANEHARRWVAWSLRNARRLGWAALMVALPAAWLTAQLYRNLSSDVEELLPRQAPSVLATDELRSRVPGLSTLGIVVDAGSPDRLPAAERLLDDLAARIRAYPPALVRGVRVGAADEVRFFDKFGPLYLSLDDLVVVRGRIEARRSWQARRTLDILLEDEPPPLLDFHDLEQKYQRQLPGVSGTDARFSNPGTAVSVLLVEGSELTARAGGARQLVARVQEDLRRLGGPQHYAPGLRVGLAGNIAVSVEELQALSEDLGISTVLVVSTVLGVILLFFGWWIAIPALLIPLALGTVTAFALAAQLPLGIDRLNSSTAFLGSIVVGNGVNFGIVWLARYAEARRRGTPVEPALAEAIAGALPGTLVAALAAATSYASLAATQFRGFRQFGVIGGIGMLTAWAATFLLSPPLLAWLERRAGRERWPISRWSWTWPPWAGPRARGADGGGRLAALLERRTVPILIVAAVLTTGAALEIRRFNASHIESDFSQLRRRDTWRSGEGFWGRKMETVLRRNLSPTVILTGSVTDARAVAARLRAAAREPRLAQLVAQIRDIDDVLPPDQPAKIAEIERIRRQITPAVRAQLSPDSTRLLDRLLGQGALRPVALADLPPSLTAGLRERNGALGRTVLVFPQLTKRLWQADELAFLLGRLRDAAAHGVPAGAPPGRVAGYLPIAGDITQALRRDGPVASGVALAAVALLVMLIFRGRRPGLWVLASLLLGVAWMLGATLAAGIKINYANFVAFPITFGIGVDYAVNIMARYRQELAREQAQGHEQDQTDAKSDLQPMAPPQPASAGVATSVVPSPDAALRARVRAIKRAVHTTGGAVALCSLTTSLGYSSLLIAKNRALSSFGAVAVSGEASCLSTAVVVMPAALLLVQRLLSRARSRRVAADTGTGAVALAAAPRVPARDHSGAKR